MPTVSNLSVEERLQRVEDQLAIYQIISAYGPAADSVNMADIAKHWVPDCEYVMADYGTAKGLDALKALFDAPFHQGLVKDGGAHIASFPHVVIDGDQAVATHYAQVFAHQQGSFNCVRVSIHRWEFSRFADGWKMLRRTTSMLDGSAASQDMLARAMQGPDSVNPSTSC